ncbi:MAG: sigma 54-interacting transcriptional regulator [Chloroflexi bacterium]|nr:sigma 54-interacting transcriptional regulator [Chloroflexota bacterium]
METKPRTIGELRRSGYRPRSVREEMRDNLIRKIRNREELFPGIIGFEDTVIPQVENAILSGHDIVFLGERGQAKSRVIRSLVNLLDEEIPVISGCEIPEDPFRPITKEGRDKVAENGDDTEIAWLGREYRYSEKLATPDITIADLIGEVDPIRVAEGRYLSDELTIHYGLVPRTNRGIFCINELPDLAERIQVGLLNILEERDVQIRGYKIRLPLDVYVVASANPEDYTNRGRIITPLKDRCGSEIRTHYPRTAAVEIDIMEREKADFLSEPYKTAVPVFMKEIVAEISALARRSPDINQRSGVSVRVSISNYENLISNAIRRAIRLNEEYSAPRISDLPYIVASISGKIELESVDEGREDQIIEKLIQGAVLNVFNRYFTPLELGAMIAKFEEGLSVETSDTMSSKVYMQRLAEMNGVTDAIKKLGAADNPATIASGLEFILEGLHLNRKLNKDKMPGKAQYRRPRS